MDGQVISENIKKYRELKGYSREIVAAELQMSTSGYSKIERGEVDLSISKIEKIARVLSVSPAKLLNFDATTVFNVSHNQSPHVQGEHGSVIHNYASDNTQKYIAMLERENERLRSFIE